MRNKTYWVKPNDLASLQKSKNKSALFSREITIEVPEELIIVPFYGMSVQANIYGNKIDGIITWISNNGESVQLLTQKCTEEGFLPTKAQTRTLMKIEPKDWMCDTGLLNISKEPLNLKLLPEVGDVVRFNKQILTEEKVHIFKNTLFKIYKIDCNRYYLIIESYCDYGEYGYGDQYTIDSSLFLDVDSWEIIDG